MEKTKEKPSILVIDDEVISHKPLAKAFERDLMLEAYNLQFFQSGLQGLKQARETINRAPTVLVIDLILPDIPGKRLIEKLQEERTLESQFQAIVISAHETVERLQFFKDKYDWIIDYCPKPLDGILIRNLIKGLLGESTEKFNYSQLDINTANFIREQTEGIKVWMRQTALGAIETGERILSIKARLNHGQFKQWLSLELECHYNTVVSLMRAAKVFGKEKERIAQSGIGVSVIYYLAQSNIPSAVREEVIQESEQGRQLGFKEVKQLAKEYIKQKKQQSQPEESSSEPSPKKQNKPSTSLSAESPSTTEPSKNKTQLQEIIQVVPRKESDSWQLDRHLLVCDYPQSKDFVSKIPAKVDLILAFPPMPDWQQSAVIPVATNSSLVLHSIFSDGDPKAVNRMVYTALELYTENNSQVVISFLPDFDILNLLNIMGCRGFIAEPNPEKCQALLKSKT